MIAPLRVLVAAICVVGIAGMIIGSIADNNNGAVVTFGLITAVSVLVLMAVTTVSNRAAGSELTDEQAIELEERIQALVAAGADEDDVRALVGRAMRFERIRSSSRPLRR